MIQSDKCIALVFQVLRGFCWGKIMRGISVYYVTLYLVSLHMSDFCDVIALQYGWSLQVVPVVDPTVTPSVVPMEW